MCYFSSNEAGFVFDGLTIFKYSPSTNEWTSLGSFEDEFRRDAVGFASGNKCYIGLGYYNTGNYLGESANSFYCFDSGAQIWTKYTSIDWNVRRGISYFSEGNKLYFGFGNESLNDNSGLKADFWEFDFSKNQLTKLISFPSTPGYKEGFSISSNFYLGLGFDGTFPSEFWCFSKTNK
jgi:N-acetylneuraminic acid mutarotase